MTKVASAFPFTLPSINHLSPDVETGCQDLINRIEAVYMDTLSKKAKIDANEDLSSKGREKAIQRLGDDARSALDTVLKEADGYRVNADQLRRTLEPKRPTMDVLRYLQEREVRDVYREIGSVEREVAYRKAANEGNLQIMDALENGPLGPMVPMKAINEVRESRLNAEHPEEVARLRGLQQAHEYVNGAVNTATAELVKHHIPAKEDSTKTVLLN